MITALGSPIPWAVGFTGRRAIDWRAVPGLHLWCARTTPRYGFDFGSTPITFNPAFAVGRGHIGLVPTCRFIDLLYDDAGVDFPDGSVQALVSQSDLPWRGAARLVNNSIGGSRVVLTSTRHWIYLTVIAGGMSADTVLTITFTRASDWQPGADAATLGTVVFYGSDGRYQEKIFAALVSAPQTLMPGGLLFTIYGTPSWTGTAPVRVDALWNPDHLLTSPVVPSTLPSGFTARNDGDANLMMDHGVVNAWFHGPTAISHGEWSPHNARFTRTPGNLDDNPSSQGVASRVDRGAIGCPDYISQTQGQGAPAVTAVTWPTRFPRPGAWINGEVKQLTYWPSSRGSLVWSYASNPIEMGSTLSIKTETSTPLLVASGNGWRNIRIFLRSRQETDAPTILAMSVRIIMDGSTVDTVDFSSSSIGDYFDVTDVFPSAGEMEAEIEVEYTVTIAGDPDEYSGIIQWSFTVLFSPRIDIPIPTYLVGADGSEAPGGYSDVIDPPKRGAVMHCAPGVTSVSWSNGADPGNQSRLISFVLPHTGVWRVKAPGSTSGSRNTYGECEFRIQPQHAVLGRGGKRFYGVVPIGTDAQTNGTWELEEFTRNAISIGESSTGGTQIVSTGLTPPSGAGVAGGYAFCECDFPAAGTYRIWVRIITISNIENSTYRFRVSRTDPWCIDYESIHAYDSSVWPVVLTTATSPPGAPSAGASYWITAPATGIWEGRENQIARWDVYQGWQYLIPRPEERATVFLDSVTSHWDGTAWLPVVAASAGRMIEVDIAVDAATTIYLRLDRDGTGEFPGIEQITPLGSNGVRVGWETV